MPCSALHFLCLLLVFILCRLLHVSACTGIMQSRMIFELLVCTSKTRACLQAFGHLCRDYLSDFQIDQFFQVCPHAFCPCDACSASPVP